MFYVIMNAAGQYLGKDQETFGSFENAYQFADERDASFSQDVGDKVVGPCREGEEP